MRRAMFVMMSVALGSVGLTDAGHAAQPPRQPDAARLARQVEKLGVTARVMYVAAHPDDENTKLLAWLANQRLVRTAYLSITRGDGGQNLIGPEQGVDLGIIRTQELLAARRVDGAEQLFTRARDFGFSKSADEALALWGKDEILADVVWAVRRFKPDLIITRFPTAGMDTHGHHTASAILAGEAFVLAADPTYHPEQVAKVGTWQAKRLLHNVPAFTGPPTPRPGDVTVAVGGYDPALGLSYGELAADSRSMHKSQGFGVARSAAPANETFRLVAGSPMQGSIFDGVELGWRHVAGGRDVATLLARANKSFDAAHPDRIVPILAQAHTAMKNLGGAWIDDKRRELVEVIVACLALKLDVTAADHRAVPGGTLSITSTVLNRSSRTLSVAHPGFAARTLEPGTSVIDTATAQVPADARITNPYWLEAPSSIGRFTVEDLDLIGLPERPSPLWVDFDLVVDNVPLTLRRTVFHAWVDPVRGEQHRAVEISPPVTATPAVGSLLFTDDRPRTLRVRLKSAVPQARGRTRVELPDGFRCDPSSWPVDLRGIGAETEVSFAVVPPKGTQAGALRVVVDLDGASWSHALSRIEYGHIPIQTRFPAAVVPVQRFALVHMRNRIGYVAGAGDEVPAALRQVGYDVTLLDEDALQHGALDRFEAIVTGVRAFNVNPRLPYVHDRLMAYVSGGGTLIVQYNTNNRLSSVPAEIGPYPFHISQDRVTDENAPVAMVSHAVLQHPQRITEADFAGWVQERGLYFAKDWDTRYETPLALSDPGEAPKAGSLLVARVGKGAFVYTGLSFFRQLPAGVAGAFRLFANLIDFGK